MGKRYKIGDAYILNFIQFPRVFHVSPKYRGLSLLAKHIYAVMFDRLQLSAKNKRVDDEKNIYVLFRYEKLAQYLNKTPKTVRNAIKELEDIGLLDVEHNGANKPNKYYPKEIDYDETMSEEQEFEEKYEGKTTLQEEKDGVKITSSWGKNYPKLGEKLPPSHTNIIKPSKSKKEIPKERVDIESDFEEVWKLYPRKQGKLNAFKDYCKAVKEGTTKEMVAEGIQKYLTHIKATGLDSKYIKQGSTYFHQHSWEDEYEDKEATPSKVFDTPPQMTDEQAMDEIMRSLE